MLRAWGSDPRIYYLIGYAYYAHPDRMKCSDIQAKMMRSFERALELQPEDSLALMYLGHNAYDLGRYDEAQSWFDRVDAASLDEMMRLKLREMQLCCCMRLSPDPCVVMLRQFVEICETSPLEIVYPMNLARAVDELKLERGAGWLAAVQSDLKRLDQAGRFTWFASVL